MQSASPSEPPTLKRSLNVADATLLGLGAIVGTGVFVSIGLAAGVTGASVVLAIALAALVAACNALSSAQLAANYPVSGGTYEYGYQRLSPLLGFTAGWMFLWAKAASAATAALGFSGYLLTTLGSSRGNGFWLVAIALVTVAGLTLVVLGGMQRSSRLNTVIVSITLGSLAVFCLTGAWVAWTKGGAYFAVNFFRGATPGERTANLLEASALMFVAFTGYGRIATLGEEVREPRQTIPRAILLTLLVSSLLYIAVGLVAVGAVGSERLFEATRTETAPLVVVADEVGLAGVGPIVSLGAMTAMLGVLLNLVLGLSRVLLAMARRGDMPRALARIETRNQQGTKDAVANPSRAVLAVGIVIAGLVLLGDVKTTWSFSAFTVLVYYAITNLAALGLSAKQRLYPPRYAWLGLTTSLFLAFWVEYRFWMLGLFLIVCGAVWHFVAQKLPRASASSKP